MNDEPRKTNPEDDEKARRFLEEICQPPPPPRSPFFPPNAPRDWPGPKREPALVPDQSDDNARDQRGVE